MEIIKNELNILKAELLSNFKDPLNNNGLRNFILSGSKYIRSTLAILYLKSQNIEIKEDTYKILCSGELIHNASLLHDDVLDNAKTRRGFPTIGEQYSAKIAILAGDYLLSYAIEKLLTIKNFCILENFQSCTKKMSKAEIKQNFLIGNLPTENKYIEICKGKTASLFASILESCAILNNLSTKEATHLGEVFGICFQIKNDLNQESAKEDKKNGIFTAKDILGIEKTSNLLDNYKEEMRKLIKNFPDNIYKKGLEDLIQSL